VVNKCLKILDKHFGHIVNSKGYKVLNHVRIIQGDGIDHTMIRAILTVMDMNGYSSDNVAFGQGGALLQQVNRDTLEFAMKCSAAYINGEWVEVYKDPITSAMKKSKKGRLMLNLIDGKYVTRQLDYGTGPDYVDHLTRRYLDGKLYNETTFDQVRAKAREGVR
jgi:nicotinamide phosphoribosyltransferase